MGILCPNNYTDMGVLCPSKFPDMQGSKFIFDVGSTCVTRCKFLGAQLKILGAQLQILGVPTPKDQKNT